MVGYCRRARDSIVGVSPCFSLFFTGCGQEEVLYMSVQLCIFFCYVWLPGAFFPSSGFIFPAFNFGPSPGADRENQLILLFFSLFAFRILFFPSHAFQNFPWASHFWSMGTRVFARSLAPLTSQPRIDPLNKHQIIDEWSTRTRFFARSLAPL